MIDTAPTAEISQGQLLAWLKRTMENMQAMAHRLRDCDTPFTAGVSLAVETALGALEELALPDVADDDR